ncbi:type II secretion system F family protein [Pseudomonas sp. UL073]|uniref:Type II secretion system F family protein n=1 Tax=Zestomonas insulae TaxID=2809017 RepID=A0ABS2IBM0_9GAMM|nr:type II secretion system F family protein [Pseudomonas insulae]MBM7059208.1 type II secretion system F family protein [Pseudomonas insulae]
MRYLIKGVRKTGGVVSLTLDAPSPSEAQRAAENQGLHVLALHSERHWRLRWPGGEAFPLLLFTQELSTLLGAGLALIDALESLAEKEGPGHARRVLLGLVRTLYEGKSFSQGLSQFPETFPALYVALAQSSEKTGAIGEALNRYVSYRKRMDEVRQTIVGASIYPLMLLLVGGGVLLFLIGYVVPRFSLVFDGLGSKLPWLSQVLLSAGKFLSAHQLGFYGSLLAGAVLATVLLRQVAVRRALARLIERVPAVRHRLFVYELARFYRSLGILLQGGIPILTALGMVRSLLGVTARASLDQACARIREGQALSASLEACKLTTPVSQRMLRAGEQAGNLGEMMERAAEFYDQETGRWIEWFVKLFEPLLMTFIGLVIGVIVILMYIPIFELASSIQ